MKRIFQNGKGLRIHLICWSIYIAYEVLLTGTVRGYYSHLYYYLLFYALNIALFYFHGRWVLPKSLGQGVKVAWRLPLLVAMEVAVYSFLSIGFSYLLSWMNAARGPLVFNTNFFLQLGWRQALFIMGGTGYYFLETALEKQRLELLGRLEIEQLNVQLIRAERDFLRSQINPHLLYNTLNFVRYAAKQNPQQADEAIHSLTGLLEFALTE
ncbi:MAG: histidine kinase, partial [Pedobacter sp.]